MVVSATMQKPIIADGKEHLMDHIPFDILMDIR